MAAPIKRILICRTDNIGDVVLTLPLAGYLKQRYPGIVIGFLVRAYAAPVVRHCRFVDHVLELETLDGGDLTAAFAAGAYDTVLFALPVRRLAVAARRAGVGRRVGTSHRLHHWLNCNRLAHFSRARSDRHEAQLNFALLKPLGIDYLPPLAAIPPLFGLVAPALVDNPGFAAYDFNLVLHTQSNGNGRQWPLRRYTELAQQLQQAGGGTSLSLGIWLTGTAREGAVLAADGAALLALPNVHNVTGRYDLDGLTGLIGAADGLIASGTGPLHLAAALGRPTLGLFPPVKPIDPARWGTLGTQASTLCVGPACRAGCADAAGCTCMDNISAAAVAGVVLGWYHAKAGMAAPALQAG
jgi:ADP-heptose:LPS heptosyltransferase